MARCNSLHHCFIYLVASPASSLTMATHRVSVSLCWLVALLAAPASPLRASPLKALDRRRALGVIAQLRWIARSPQLSPPRAHVLRSAGVVPPMRELQRLGATETERNDALLALWAMDAFRPEDAVLRVEAETLAHDRAYV